MPVKHGILDILGWEVRESVPGTDKAVSGKAGKSFLYLTDTSAIPSSSLALLKTRIDVIIIGGLRIRPHETHFSFEEALDAAAAIGADEIYLTHICHDRSHAQIEELCRDYKESRGLRETEIHPARDGLEIRL
jgi:phosphoribosyl 1,2-cyclic phosphate phosphodiesterase